MIDLDVQQNNDPAEELVNEIRIEPRRSSRERQLPQRLNDFELIADDVVNSEGELIHFALLAESKPVSLEETMKNHKWIHVMEEELQSIERNQTWELVDLPVQKKPITVKWVFKVKLNPDGVVSKYKARLVVEGFLQNPGIDIG